MSVQILQGDCLKRLKDIEDNSVNCCVTSPPYWNLRDYNCDGQIGKEKTPEQYVELLVSVFEEVRRVLKDDGTLWLNLGDSYSNNNSGSLKTKDLIGIPFMAAFALRDAGWHWRAPIVWHKPNPMPESVKDRPTIAHEYIWLFSKKSRYYYDWQAIAEPLKQSSIGRLSQNTEKQKGSDRANAGAKINGTMKAVAFGGNKHEGYGTRRHSGNEWVKGSKANKRTVWSVANQGFKEAHFATFPPKLIEPCILAGCPEGGTVLDPFFGAGTTGLVADQLGRNCIGIELNPEYISIAQKRINGDAGMFGNVTSKI